MKFVISLIKSIINPISVLFNLLIGFLAAMLSGTIEYFVLRDLFSKIIIDGTEKTLTFLPLVIVLVLEGSKLFLHFGSSALNNVSEDLEPSTTDFAKSMDVIKKFLIVFSFICTIIFTGNVLYFNNVELNSKNLETQISEINQKYDDEVEACKQKYINLKDSEVESYKIAWENAENALLEHNTNPVLSPRVAYERYEQERITLENAVEEKHQEYDNALKDVNMNINDDENYKNEISELNRKRNDEIEKLKSNSIESNSGDSEYIKTFLLLIFNTFFKAETYPRWLYFIITILISFVIAGVLEAVIYVSQRLISISSEEMSKAFEADHMLDQATKDKAKKIIGIILSAAFSFSIYIVYGLIKEISMNKFNILSGLVCCVITVVACLVIPTFTYHQKKAPKNTIEKASDSFKEFLATEGKMMLIKGLLSFVLFIVLGVIYDKEIAEITIPAIGVATGQIIGQLLHINPKTITI